MLLRGLLVVLAALLGYYAAKRHFSPVHDLWYWLGWLDPTPEQRPANSKIIYTVAALAAIVLCILIGLRMIAKAMEVNWPYVGLVTIVLSFAAGVEVFKKTVSYMASRTTSSKTVTVPAPPSSSTTDTMSAPTPGTTP